MTRVTPNKGARGRPRRAVQPSPSDENPQAFRIQNPQDYWPNCEPLTAAMPETYQHIAHHHHINGHRMPNPSWLPTSAASASTSHHQHQILQQSHLQQQHHLQMQLQQQQQAQQQLQHQQQQLAQQQQQQQAQQQQQPQQPQQPQAAQQPQQPQQPQPQAHPQHPQQPQPQAHPQHPALSAAPTAHSAISANPANSSNPPVSANPAHPPHSAHSAHPTHPSHSALPPHSALSTHPAALTPHSAHSAHPAHPAHPVHAHLAQHTVHAQHLQAAAYVAQQQQNPYAPQHMNPWNIYPHAQTYPKMGDNQHEQQLPSDQSAENQMGMNGDGIWSEDEMSQLFGSMPFNGEYMHNPVFQQGMKVISPTAPYMPTNPYLSFQYNMMTPHPMNPYMLTSNNENQSITPNGMPTWPIIGPYVEGNGADSQEVSQQDFNFGSEPQLLQTVSNNFEKAETKKGDDGKPFEFYNQYPSYNN